MAQSAAGRGDRDYLLDALDAEAIILWEGGEALLPDLPHPLLEFLEALLETIRVDHSGRMMCGR